jgi:dipeptidyl aminopeptidase/acylaminoacyl peptidase
MSRPSFAAVCVFILCTGMLAVNAARPQQRPEAAADPLRQRLDDLQEALNFAQESLGRAVDDLQMFRRLDDLAEVDKVRYTGPPARVVKNPTAPGAQNPVVLTAYTFMPRKRPAGAKLPLVVLVHGGIHGNFDTSHIPILRELLAQGYAVIAPEYRGSAGYGKDFWQLIDYGGLEVEDVFAGRQWMLENHAAIDPARVGIMGWSHGGLIALMNLFAHPKEYQVGYAGVPVCDLVARMGYKGQPSQHAPVSI